MYERFGLTALDDPAQLVLTMAVQKYSSNMRFATMMARIEGEHKMKMEGLLMGRRDPNEAEFAGAEDEDDAERLAQLVEGAMVGTQERIVEEELKGVGKRPPKVEVLPEDSPNEEKSQSAEVAHSAPLTPHEAS